MFQFDQLITFSLILSEMLGDKKLMNFPSTVQRHANLPHLLSETKQI